MANKAVELVTRKYGPLPGWAWGLGGIAAYFGYEWYKNRSASTSGAPTGAGTAAPVGGAGSSTPGTTSTPTGTPPPTGGPTTKKKVWCLVKSPVPHYKKCAELDARKSNASGGNKPAIAPAPGRSPGAGGRNNLIYAPRPHIGGQKPVQGKKAKPPKPAFHPVGSSGGPLPHGGQQ